MHQEYMPQHLQQSEEQNQQISLNVYNYSFSQGVVPTTFQYSSLQQQIPRDKNIRNNTEDSTAFPSILNCDSMPITSMATTVGTSSLDNITHLRSPSKKRRNFQLTIDLEQSNNECTEIISEGDTVIINDHKMPRVTSPRNAYSFPLDEKEKQIDLTPANLSNPSIEVTRSKCNLYTTRLPQASEDNSVDAFQLSSSPGLSCLNINPENADTDSFSPCSLRRYGSSSESIPTPRSLVELSISPSISVHNFFCSSTSRQSTDQQSFDNTLV
jgi:hypothetical protein